MSAADTTETQGAKEQIEGSSIEESKTSRAKVVIAGEPITDSEFLRGYNTYYQLDDGSHSARLAPGSSATIVSAVCGVVDVVERVVSVRGLHPRYVPEIGDVVVGRILEVGMRRWTCDVGAHQDAVMLLSNVTAPGGLLRRRGREDELSMRNLFTENDVFAAEVQRTSADGSIGLHTRAANKYGRLGGIGQLVTVKPCLVRRVRRHFHTFTSHAVTTILGTNGYIWVSGATQAQLDEAAEQNEADGAGTETPTDDMLSVKPDDTVAVRRSVARFANVLKVMSDFTLPIYPEAILVAVNYTIDASLAPNTISERRNAELIALHVTAQRQAKVGSKRRRE